MRNPKRPTFALLFVYKFLCGCCGTCLLLSLLHSLRCDRLLLLWPVTVVASTATVAVGGRPSVGKVIHVDPWLPPCLDEQQPICDVDQLRRKRTAGPEVEQQLEKNDVPLSFGPDSYRSSGLAHHQAGSCTDRWTSDVFLVKNRTLYSRFYVCLYDAGSLQGVLKWRCGFSAAVTYWIEVVHPSFGNEQEFQEMNPNVTSMFRSRRSLATDFAFVQNEYRTEVEEEQSANVRVLTVAVYNPKQVPLLYSMVASQDVRSSSLFAIDRSTGDVFTTSRLDREQMTSHVFKVTAYDARNPNRQATTMVFISVLDVNDHWPVFERSNYAAAISEAAEVGTTVMHMYAKDSDVGPNGRVTYRVVDGDRLSQFSLDPDSGVLKVRKPLDREQTDFYRLNVQACDRAEIGPRCTMALVEVSVEDENDNYPQFDQLKYAVNISENTDPSTKPVIGRVSATDVDNADNGKVHYSIVSGNVGKRFSIDYDTGEVRLLREVNHRLNPHFDLVIRAQDSGSFSLSNTTVMTVTVEDVNDNAPRFYTNFFQETVREDVPVGYQVLQLLAYDADSGTNAQIRYGLMPPSGPSKSKAGAPFPFGIDPVTGWITVIDPLDHETTASFDFHVSACDRGRPPLCTIVRVVIKVTDVNDNAPAFEQKVYNVSVPENATRGTPLLVLKASDPDDSIARLDYSISSGNEKQHFILLSQSDHCTLAVNGQLDYKSQARYLLTVKVLDADGQADTSAVYVQVTDVNSAPLFVEHPFSITVTENEKVGSTVAVVEAMDLDDGQNAEIGYTLDDGGTGHFQIDNRTGVITVKKALDREEMFKYQLKIKATDNGVPPLSSTTELEVVVEDVNDHTPSFLEAEYVVKISEDTPVGTSFYQMVAVDQDAGDNARMSYFFGSDDVSNGSTAGAGTATNPFLIDATSGIVRVSRPLDRELMAVYRLAVLAVDKGTPPLTGSTVLTIELQDVNDNAPKFATDVYYFDVPENTPIGSKIGWLTAADPDQGSNGLISYRIFEGVDMQHFEIAPRSNGDGVDVISRTELDYESKQRLYRFQIQASSGDLSSIAEVVIAVLDVNDHRPVLHDFLLVFNNYDGHFPPGGTSFGKVPAYDPDANDTLTYRMIAENDVELVAVDETTGHLYLTEHLDTNRVFSAKAKVCVSGFRHCVRAMEFGNSARDGANVVCATCMIKCQYITDDTLFNSVTVRTVGATVHSFLNPTAFGRFVHSIVALTVSDPDDVIVFSVKNDGQLNGESVMNISFAVRQPGGDSFVSGEQLLELVNLNRPNISAVSHLDILSLGENLCVLEPCLNFERCQSTFKFGEAASFITTSTFLFRPIHPISSFSCVCPPGYAGMNHAYDCDTEVDLCYSSPCLNGGTCLSTENGFSCACPSNSTGSQCEIPLNSSFCVPGVCKGQSRCDVISGQAKCTGCGYQMSMTNPFCQLTTASFISGSYLAFPPLKQRSRLRVKLKFASVHPDGLLLHNGRYNVQRDFLSLELKQGRLKLSFSFGDEDSRSLLLDSGYVLNDGRWHEVEVSFFNGTALMSLDECNFLTEDEDLDEKPRFSRCFNRTTHYHDGRCSNPAVHCFRFLDFNSPLYVGGVPLNKPRKLRGVSTFSFIGCLRDVYVDHLLLDLNSALVSHKTSAGCRPMTSGCGDGPQDAYFCQNNGTCVAVWNGYLCRCGDLQDGRNCTDVMENSRSFTHATAYVVYETPKLPVFGYELGVSFRTHQTSTDVLTAEFFERRRVVFKIFDGYMTLHYGKEKYRLDGPFVADAAWHTAAVHFRLNQLIVTIDQTHITRIALLEMSYNDWERIYAGRVPGLYGSAPFLGCIKAVFLTDFGGRRRYLAVEKENATEPGRCRLRKVSHLLGGLRCVAPGPQGSVSTPSLCQADCQGSGCSAFCVAQPCQNNGTCISGPSPPGYKCLCPVSFTGKHCEIPLLYGSSASLELRRRRCPQNWWGQPMCRKCACDVSKGYDPDCDKTTGECWCKAFHYRDLGSDRCTPCNCFYPIGTANRTCDIRTGQCYCRPNVVGRECGQCKSPKAQINRKTSLCEVVTNACPERWSDGVLWPATLRGQLIKQRCGSGFKGFAVRHCGKNGEWTAVSLSNCSAENFAPLENILNKLQRIPVVTPGEAKRIARQIRNTTGTLDWLYKRDYITAVRLLSKLLDSELNPNSTIPAAHQHDRYFVENIMASAGKILTAADRWSNEEQDERMSRETVLLLENLHDYGLRLANYSHRKAARPFAVKQSNIVYSVELLNAGKQATSSPLSREVRFDLSANKPITICLPSTAFQQLETDVDASPALFYAAYEKIGPVQFSTDQNGQRQNVKKRHIADSPVVSVGLIDAEGRLVSVCSEPLYIHFPIDKAARLLVPQCVWWAKAGNLSGFVSADARWKSSGCFVSSHNESTVVCGCNHMSTFAVLMKEWLPLRSSVSYVGMTVVSASIVVLLSIYCYSVWRRGCKCCALTVTLTILVVCYTACLIGYELLSRFTVPEMTCRAIGCALLFAQVAYFTWLFLVPLQMYRWISCGTDDNDSDLFWFYQLIGWGIPVLVNSVALYLWWISSDYLERCWIGASQPYVWLSIVPIGILSFLTLAVSVWCFSVVSTNKLDTSFQESRQRILLTLILAVCSTFHWVMAFLSYDSKQFWILYLYYIMLAVVAVLLALLTLVFWPDVPPSGSHRHPNRKYVNGRMADDRCETLQRHGVSADNEQPLLERPQCAEMDASLEASGHSSTADEMCEFAQPSYKPVDKRVVPVSNNGMKKAVVPIYDQTYTTAVSSFCPSAVPPDLIPFSEESPEADQAMRGAPPFPLYQGTGVGGRQPRGLKAAPSSVVVDLDPDHRSTIGRVVLNSRPRGPVILSSVEKILSDTESDASSPTAGAGPDCGQKIATLKKRAFSSSPRHVLASDLHPYSPAYPTAKDLVYSPSHVFRDTSL